MLKLIEMGKLMHQLGTINPKIALPGIILQFSISFTGLHAQNVVSATGNNASGSGGTISFTVGQIVYTTIPGTNGSLAQGVQQPYEISVMTEIEKARDIVLDFLVYPNPTSDNLRLVMKNFDLNDVRYQLYNINGVLLQDHQVLDSETLIPMQGQQPSTYFLKILQGNKEIKTFKIIKN